MDITLTEEMIRQRTSQQSFRKGWNYYRAHSIFDEYFQTTPNGIVLYAQCRGSFAPSYYLRVVLTRDGISSAACTCPYDYGGDCKHIVALLLEFLQEPEKFPERTSVNELVAGLEKDELEELLIQLLRTHPGLYNQVELSVALLKLAPTTIEPKLSGEARSSADRSANYEKLLRKQVKRILAERASYGDEYEDEPDYGYSYSYDEYTEGDEYAETDEDEEGYDFKAYIGLFNQLPSLPVYRAIKRLAGEDWESMRPAMIERIETGGYSHDLLLGIYMEEESFDEAIALAESRIYDTSLLAKVVKAVLHHRPDWAIRQSTEQADAIIAQTNSTRYPDAARWLEYAKEAYLQAGRMDEWEGLIAQVREIYYRRKALLKAIAHL